MLGGRSRTRARSVCALPICIHPQDRARRANGCLRNCSRDSATAFKSIPRLPMPTAGPCAGRPGVWRARTASPTPCAGHGRGLLQQQPRGRAASAAGREAGSCRPSGRRRGSRLQQSSDRSAAVLRSAHGQPGTLPSSAQVCRRNPQRRHAGYRPGAAVARRGPAHELRASSAFAQRDRRRHAQPAGSPDRGKHRVEVPTSIPIWAWSKWTRPRRSRFCSTWCSTRGTPCPAAARSQSRPAIARCRSWPTPAWDQQHGLASVRAVCGGRQRQRHGCRHAQLICSKLSSLPRPGKGTGLGLATVHDIVTSNGGLIHVESAPARGTRVSVLLPLVPEAVLNSLQTTTIFIPEATRANYTQTIKEKE